MSAGIAPAESPAGPVVRLSNVVKTYDDDGLKVSALGGISFDIGRQRFTMIVGPSGSGKTTLAEPDRLHRRTDSGAGRGRADRTSPNSPTTS